MFKQVAKAQTSRQQRRWAPVVRSVESRKGGSSTFTGTIAIKALRKANEAAERQGGAPIAIRADQQKNMIDDALRQLQVAQAAALAEDDALRERRMRPYHGSPQGNSESSKSSDRPLSYDDRNMTTGKSALQEWFDELVCKAVVQHCLPGVDEMRPSELLTCIRRVMPEFSFSKHCDGVPFSLLIKNCNFLQCYGGKVHFSAIRAGDSKTEDDEVHVLKEESERSHDAAIIGLRKYKLRESQPVDGVRQGPQPWLYNGRMLDFSLRRRGNSPR